jgi:GntR family transcriptional repressor for pyruvate dehydrogenase complex
MRIQSKVNRRLSEIVGPIEIRVMTEHLVHKMKAWFLQGLIQPGERLPPERELAVMLKVSRSSLRDALKVLQVMGLLESRQGSGNYVSANAPAILQHPTDLLVPLRGLSFAELFEARRAMEAEAAACAAVRATEADLHKLTRALEQMRAVLADPAAYVKADILFHRYIAQAAGNGVFLWFFDLVPKALYDAWLARAKEASSERTFAEHQEITAAILQRNDERARSAMLHHLMLGKYYTNQSTQLEFRVIAHPTR